MTLEPYFWPRVVVGAGVVVAFLFAAKLHAREARRPASTLNAEAMIEAIADVESGNDPAAVGALGELGRCQFRRTTWSELTNAPFEVYARRDCELTRKIERAHLARICTQLSGFGHVLTPALIAAAWRAGTGNAVRFARTDPARRAANLYFDQPTRTAKPLPR